MPEENAPGEAAPAAVPGLDAAVAAVLNDIAPLLTDRDVGGVLIDAGAIAVTRRGALERISARVSDDAWTALEQVCPEGVHGLQHERATVSVTKHQRVMLRVALVPRASTLDALVERGALTEDGAAALRLSLLDGESHIVCGASAAARAVFADAACLFLAQRFVTFCAPAAADLIAGGAFAWPLRSDGACDVEAVVALGASFVRADDVSSEDVRAWHARGVRVVATSPFIARGASALSAPDAPHPFGAAKVLSVGARLHGGPVLNAQSTKAPAVEVPASVPAAAVVRALPPAPVAAVAPVAAEPAELPPLQPLPSGPPAGWATDDDTAAPGWELSSPPGPVASSADTSEEPFGAAGDAFAKVLGDVKERPAFTPQKPAAHPQAKALQQQASTDEEGPDPFGGLTFEPPPGGEGGGA